MSHYLGFSEKRKIRKIERAWTVFNEEQQAQGCLCGKPGVVGMSDPRNNADDAYAAFMGMTDDEWWGLLRSLIGGGCLQVEEKKGSTAPCKIARHVPLLQPTERLHT